jgi:hypothetical protein
MEHAMATVLLLPPCETSAATAICAVDGGVLTYTGGWRHVHQCVACANDKPCNRRDHAGCDAPEPERCPHCGAVAAVDTTCSTTPGGACCGCCWIPAHQNGTS